MLNKSAMTVLYWLIETVRRFAENLKNEVPKYLRFHKRTDSKSQPHISNPRQFDKTSELLKKTLKIFVTIPLM